VIPRPRRPAGQSPGPWGHQGRGHSRHRPRGQENRRAPGPRSHRRKARERTQVLGLRGTLALALDWPGPDPACRESARTDAGRTVADRTAVPAAGRRGKGPAAAAGTAGFRTAGFRTAGFRTAGFPAAGFPAAQCRATGRPVRPRACPLPGRRSRARYGLGRRNPVGKCRVRRLRVRRGRGHPPAGRRLRRTRVLVPTRDRVRRRPGDRSPPGQHRLLARRRRQGPVARAAPQKTFPR
jgi:hypothetical protein